MPSIIEKYKASGNLKLFIDFRKGSLRDQSGNSNDAAVSTASNILRWANGKTGRCVFTPQNNSTGTYTQVANSASTNITSGTLVTFGYRVQSSTGFQGIADKVNVYNQLFSNSTFGIYDHAGAVFRASTYVLADSRPHVYVTRFQSGVASGTKFFVDGVGYGTVTFTQLGGAAALAVGYGEASTQGWGGGVYAALLFNNQLTDQEVAQLTEELFAGGSNLHVEQNRIFQKPKDTHANLLLDIDCETRFEGSPASPLRSFVDLSGNNKHFSTVSRVDRVQNHGIVGVKFNGAGYISRAADATFFQSNFTCLIEIPEHANVAGAVILLGSGSNDYLSFINGATANFAYPRISIMNGTPAQSTITSTVGIPPNTPAQIAYIVETSGANVTGSIYINNVLAISGALSVNGKTNPAGPTPIIGALTTAPLNSLDGSVARVRYYTAALNAAERTARYNEFAKHLVMSSLQTDMPVTLANVSAGYLPGTSWQRSSGNWSIVEANDKKWINCVSGFSAFAQQRSAYGSFCFRYYTGTALTNNTYFSFIASGTSLLTPGNHYYVQVNSAGRLLLNRTGAIMAQTGDAYVAANTYYEMVVTRTFAGVFNLYIRGGAYANWTLALTATHTGFTTSSYCIVSAEAPQSFRLSSLSIFEGVIDPTVNPELIPA